MLENFRTLFCHFTPVEERLLAEFVKLLPAGAATTVKSQIASFNKVQRLLDWSEINFYHLRKGKPAWEEVDKCANKGELNVAEFHFILDGKGFRARFVFIGGHLFSLIIRPSIKRYAFGVISEIVWAKLLADPNEVSSHASGKSLPESFIQWLGEHKEREINGWDVLQEGEVYPTQLADADYLVLAIRRGAEYLITKNGSDGVIYLADAEETHVRPLGRSFREALTA